MECRSDLNKWMILLLLLLVGTACSKSGDVDFHPPAPVLAPVPTTTLPSVLEFNQGGHMKTVTSGSYSTNLSLGSNSNSVSGQTSNGYQINLTVQGQSSDF